jgi:hypothetical protein
MSAVALTLAGCGPGNGLTMGLVSGQVTYKGEPVEVGEVLFVPDSEKGNSGVPSMGVIGKDGRYTMSTQEAGDGVIAGFQKVGVRALEPEQGAQTEVPPLDPEKATGQDLFAAKLKRRKAAAQSARKRRAKSDAATLMIGGSVYRFLAPEKLANPETSGIRVQIARGSNRVDFAIQEDGTVKVSQ